jgi:hypothetical protein
LNLNLEYYRQTNPEGRTRLTRRLIMDLISIIIAISSIARTLCKNLRKRCGIA